MSVKTVLITGGAGFIGSNLALKLLKENFRVIILDDLSRSTTENIRSCYNFGQNFYFVKDTVLDPVAVDRAVANADYVFHLAAQVHWEESIDSPTPSFEINAVGTMNILEAIRRHQTAKSPVKLLLYASSSEVYGTGEYVPMDEKHPFNPSSPYAAGKAAADRLCSAYHHVYKIPVVILRQFNTYGQGQRLKGYSAVVPKFINQVFNGTPPSIYGEGRQAKDFHHISDLLQAYSLIIDHADDPAVIGETINFGTGIETSVNELAQVIITAVADATGKSVRDLKPVHLPPRPGEVMRLHADISKAKKLLGFEPKCALKDGIEQYVEWFQREGRK